MIRSDDEYRSFETSGEKLHMSRSIELDENCVSDHEVPNDPAFSFLPINYWYTMQFYEHNGEQTIGRAIWSSLNEPHS